MTKLRFIPIFEDELYISACEEYHAIWKNDSKAIISAFTKIAGLDLAEERIAVVVYEGVSFSGRAPNDVMKLRASYESDVKKSTLIHELAHRLLFNHKTKSSEEEHRLLYLFLFDVWEQLYGLDFAKRMVAVESNRAEMYKTAWEFALSMNREQRQELLRDKLDATPN